MKKLLFSLLFVVNCNAMSDGSCGSVKSSDWNSPNDRIARLNGACKIDNHADCPFKCKTYYAHVMIEAIKQLVEDLYNENMIDIETMEREILSLRNEKNAEMINQVLDKIQNLKEKDGGI
ncbi:MAG TPA: hypothetical protein VNX68_09360 [Nitrosopumilaceae archaeon]|jgi:hypothetical protein|nr:hypothetical protein [Nitrosopumilaceae archaeon]